MPTNPYYTKVFGALPGSLARANSLTNEFELIQGGFDRIGALTGANWAVDIAALYTADSAEVGVRQAISAGMGAIAGTHYRIFVQALEPIGEKIGDIWTWGTGGAVTVFSRWSGSAWIDSLANQRASTYLGEFATPALIPVTGRVIGDLARRLDTNEVLVWNGSAWITSVNPVALMFAYVTREEKARADALSAEASSRDTLSAQLRGAYTGTDASVLSTGLIWSERSARVTADSALSTRTDSLESTVNNVTTGVAATAGAVSTLQSTVNNGLTGVLANSTRTDTLFSKIDSPTVSNNSTYATLTNSYSTTATMNSAIASSASIISARLNSGGDVYGSIVSAQSTASAKSANFVQPGAPTATKIGDLWIDTGNANLLKQWNGAAWVTADDQRIGATASSVTTLSSQVNDAATGLPATYSAVQTEATTRASQTGDLFAQYTVKLDVNGKVSGFGLASTGPTGIGSSFEVRADKFAIAAPSGAAAGYVPFEVLTTPTLVGGVTVPAGVYAKSAYILDGQITNAKIANLAVDDAKINSLSASKINAGSMNAGYLTAGTITATQIAAGAITADRIDARGLTIKDALGNVIINAGNGLDFNTRFGANTTGLPANGATVGATWGSNLAGTPANLASLSGLENFGANLLNAKNWVIGAAGSQSGADGTYWYENPTSPGGGNYISLDPGPDGISRPVWTASSGTAVGTSPEGGISSTGNVAIDRTKPYRFSCWIKVLGNTSGNVYLGIGANQVEAIPSGVLDSNPYFIVAGRGSLPYGTWLLFTGVVLPAGYAGAQLGLGGIYNGATGAKILNATDFRWAAGQTIANLWTFQYYTTGTSNWSLFTSPRFDVLDGSEPSLASLMTDAVLAAAQAAQGSANTANAALANIASDGYLTSGEKSAVVKDYAVITSEQGGIDTQAGAYGITIEKAPYDNAVVALTSYLSTLSGWNVIPGVDVAIVGSTFRSKFSDVYTTRQTLLNAIYAQAKALANAAATTANWSGVTNIPSAAGSNILTVYGIDRYLPVSGKNDYYADPTATNGYAARIWLGWSAYNINGNPISGAGLLKGWVIGKTYRVLARMKKVGAPADAELGFYNSTTAAVAWNVNPIASLTTSWQTLDLGTMTPNWAATDQVYMWHGTASTGGTSTNCFEIDWIYFQPVNTAEGATVNQSDAITNAAIATKLTNAATNVMATNFFLQTNGYAGGNGIALYDGGLIAKNAGVTKFAIDSAGNATFAGDISGSTIGASGGLSLNGATWANNNIGFYTGLETGSAVMRVGNPLGSNIKFNGSNVSFAVRDFDITYIGIITNKPPLYVFAFGGVGTWTAGIGFTSSGLIEARDTNVISPFGLWYGPQTTNIGGAPGAPAYWIRASQTAGTPVSGSLLNTWLGLDATRAWTVSSTALSSSGSIRNTADLTIIISNSATGSPIISTMSATLTSEATGLA